MKKYKNKIITGFIIVVLLVVAFLYGGKVPSSDSLETKEKVNIIQNEITDDKIESQSKNDISLPVVEKVESSVQSESNKENVTVTKEDTGEDKYKTDPVPYGKPEPVEPENTAVTDKELTCTLSVRCDTILNNLDLINKEKADIVPKDGVIFSKKTVVFYEGESVFNILTREMKRNKIHLEFVNVPIYNSAYIEGIANLYEFDCGELSGWMYKVNDWFPNYGCSRYKLKEGDRVEWVYTCDLGKDVGGGYSKRNGN